MKKITHCAFCNQPTTGIILPLFGDEPAEVRIRMCLSCGNQLASPVLQPLLRSIGENNGKH